MLEDTRQDIGHLGVGARIHRVGLHTGPSLALLVADLADEPVQLIDCQAWPGFKVARVLHLYWPLVA